MDPRLVGTRSTDGRPLDGASLPWRDWLQRYFPSVCSQPFGARHIRLWEWFESLKTGEWQPAQVEVWGRGGAKSSTAELAVVRCGVRLSRRYVLYVSDTQEQADQHVSSISTFMEAVGIERSLNKYGNPKAWRRQTLRTANGFSVQSIGLDTAARGVKMDEFRPDLIIFDDLDKEHDTEKTTLKKIASITTSIIPAGSSDCVSLFIQNLIHDESIFQRLVDGRADFLLDRNPAQVEPAVYGLQYERVDRGDGLHRYRVTGGTPTWAGQDLKVCEKQINDWGLTAFLREAQHQVTVGAGYMFDVAQLRSVKPQDVPELVSVCLAWDLAGTEGAGNWTAGALLGKAKNGRFYFLALIYGQWASERVRGCISLTLPHFKSLFPHLKHHLPQDGGQAGKDQAQQLKAAYPGAAIEPVTGPKAARAMGFAEQVNLGNVSLVEQDLPDFLAKPGPQTGNRPLMEDLSWNGWHRRLKRVLGKFQEDVKDQQDDEVDAGADAFNELNGPGRKAHFFD